MDRSSAGLNRPALHEIRHAVRTWAGEYRVRSVVVALSGGADSLALTAAAASVLTDVQAVVVDHRLQDGSGAVAEAACAQAIELGCITAEVVTVAVGGRGGPEAAARRARYDALSGARAGRPVLLGHTLDDQAESVLLGLGRGSGPRSIHGMAAFDDPWGRPLLGVRRERTRSACTELGLVPWEDPHNDDPMFRRVRLRTEVLPLLEDVLAGGVAAALARTAAQLRDDGDVLDNLAATALAEASRGPDLDIAALSEVPAAIRRRVIRAWLLGGGASAVTDGQLRSIDDLIGLWRGQGGVAVPGSDIRSDSEMKSTADRAVRLVASRRHGRLTLNTSPAAL